MALEKMACCGALTHVYADATKRQHKPGCKYYGIEYYRGYCILPLSGMRVVSIMWDDEQVDTATDHDAARALIDEWKNAR